MIYALSAIALAASVIANPLASISNVPRIVGNSSIAKIEDFPYQVSVQLDGVHFCGGSLLSRHYVLTAAHCVLPHRDYSIRVNSSSRIEGGMIYKIKNHWIHENFTFKENDRAPTNDIALLYTKFPIVDVKYAVPIKLFETNEEASAGTVASVTGWGTTDPEKNIQSIELRSAEVPIISKRDCANYYKDVVGVFSKGQICAGKGTLDSCKGDSGGPLVIKDRLAGVVSWGKYCGDSRYPGVYTEVAYYRNWIRSITGI